MQKRPVSGRIPISSYRRQRPVKRAAPMNAPLPYLGAFAQPAAQRQFGRPAIQEVKSCDMVLAAGAVLILPAAVAGAEPAAAYTGLTETNLIRQDATVAGRIGNKVVIKSVQVTAHFNVLAVANSGSIRAMLVYDRQPNGAFPILTDIIIAQPAGAASPLSGINIANKSRFQMVRDQYFCINGGGESSKTLSMYCKGRWEVEYGANAGNIGDFRTGAMYFIAFYLTAIAVAPTLSFLHVRNRYYD